MSLRSLACTLIALALAAPLAGCGKMGALDRPGPLFGDAKPGAADLPSEPSRPATIDPRNRASDPDAGVLPTPR